MRVINVFSKQIFRAAEKAPPPKCCAGGRVIPVVVLFSRSSDFDYDFKAARIRVNVPVSTC
jgi:hypothetical protein